MNYQFLKVILDVISDSEQMQFCINVFQKMKMSLSITLPGKIRIQAAIDQGFNGDQLEVS